MIAEDEQAFREFVTSEMASLRKLAYVTCGDWHAAEDAVADVPYTQLHEMDDINPDFPRTDVSLVIGANDVVNPAAKNTPGSPIYGMPVLNVEQSAAVIVLKRSMNTGFAGIENELFYDPRTTMLFGDAKESVAALTAAVKSA